MNWEDYKILSEKTLSLNFHCDEKKVELLLHAVMGIMTELEEIIEWVDKEDKIGMSEELSDIFWYCAIISRLYPEVNLTYFNDDNLNTERENSIKELNSEQISVFINKTTLNIFKNSAKILDVLKKKIFYNKAINDVVIVECGNKIMNDLCEYSMYAKIDYREGLNRNIAKLKSRYGDKFSSERAINRDLDTERSILEGKN